jgi:hypothetical protein
VRQRIVIAMKLLTLPRLLIIAILISLVCGGVWLDRQDTPMRNGDIVIDEAFLHRLQTDDKRTTHDPAIKGLLILEYRRATLLNDLRTGKVSVNTHRGHGDSVVVKVMESDEEGRVATRVMTFSRHHRKTWEWFSPKWWQEEILHRPYWNG